MTPMGLAGIGGVGGIARIWPGSVPGGITPSCGVQAAGTTGADPTGGVSATRFAAALDKVSGAGQNDVGNLGSLVSRGLSRLESLDATAAGKAVQAATGDLTDVHDYVIAAVQAQVATELTTTVRNKALEAFNEIMRMPL
jgi:flagellar hook-basal body complex protein FliE